MTVSERGQGLQVIFSFFLGLMVTTFIGVGVYTFHPPDEELDERIQEIDREQRVVQGPSMAGEPTPERAAEIRELEAEREELYEASREARERWGKSTSIVLIIFATLVMVVSLIRSDQLPVISNGLLLGGVFTMVYGVGWIVASDTSLTRFFVVTAALVITLGLGYMRFVRRREASLSSAGFGPGGVSLPAGGEGFTQLETRLRAVEERMEAARRAFEGR